MRSEILLSLILLLQGALLFTSLEDRPHWYNDDGVNMDLAWNMANGEARLYAIKYSFIPHPPLFFTVLAVLLKAFGNRLIVSRSLTCVYSMLTTILLYYTGKKIGGKKLGLTAAFFFAIYPQNLYWSRLGFANSQLMLLATASLCFFLLGGGLRKLSYVMVSLALITELTAVALFSSVLILLYVRGDGKEFIYGLFLMSSLPAAVYSLIFFSPLRSALLFDLSFGFSRFTENLRFFGVVLAFAVLLALWRKRIFSLMKKVYFLVKNAFIQDVLFTFGRYSETILKQKPIIALVLINAVLATQTLRPYTDELLFRGSNDYFFEYYVIGLAGLFMLKDRTPLVYFMPIFLLTLSVGRTDHMILPLYPFFCLGLAVLLPELMKSIYGTLKLDTKKKSVYFTVFVLIYYPLGATLVYDIQSFIYGRGLLGEDTESFHDVVSYIDNTTQEDDVVLSTHHISRLVQARGVGVMQGLVAEGRTLSYYGRTAGPERFVFNSSYKLAKYVVLPNGSFDWFIEENMTEFVSDVESWPIVYRKGNYLVYANPGLNKIAAPEDDIGPYGQESQ